MSVTSGSRGAIERRFIAAIRRMTHLFDRYSKLLEERVGITGSQLACLAALSRRGSRPAGELSDLIMLDPSTLTGILGRLQARGLVTRKLDRRDRRVRKIAITAGGRRLLESAPPTMQKALAGWLHTTRRAEGRRIVRALEQVTAWMEAINNTIPFRPPTRRPVLRRGA
jgi:DNA-binding MarR family transcriptional regulator